MSQRRHLARGVECSADERRALLGQHRAAAPGPSTRATSVVK